MIVAREGIYTDVRVSELMLGLTDMSPLVCLGFIKVNADLVASWSTREYNTMSDIINDVNQRTNGPVNAQLISRPHISTQQHTNPK